MASCCGSQKPRKTESTRLDSARLVRQASQPEKTQRGWWTKLLAALGLRDQPVDASHHHHHDGSCH